MRIECRPSMLSPGGGGRCTCSQAVRIVLPTVPQRKDSPGGLPIQHAPRPTTPPWPQSGIGMLSAFTLVCHLIPTLVCTMWRMGSPDRLSAASATTEAGENSINSEISLQGFKEPAACHLSKTSQRAGARPACGVGSKHPSCAGQAASGGMQGARGRLAEAASRGRQPGPARVGRARGVCVRTGVPTGSPPGPSP